MTDEMREEANELEQSELDTRALVCRLIPRVEYVIRAVEQLGDRQAAHADASQRTAEEQRRLASEFAQLAEIVGTPPDAARGHPGSGLYGLVATLWSERRGAAIGAILGGSGAIGLVELAKAILEVLR